MLYLTLKCIWETGKCVGQILGCYYQLRVGRMLCARVGLYNAVTACEPPFSVAKNIISRGMP